MSSLRLLQTPLSCLCQERQFYTNYLRAFIIIIAQSKVFLMVLNNHF